MQCVFVVIDGASPHPRVAIVIIGCRWGLRLAAARCHHWGYMGVATRVGGAPRPYVIVGGTWGHSSHYPRHHVGCGALCHALVEGPLYHPIVVVGIACGFNSHWQRASWRQHHHGCHWGRSHRHRGLGRESQQPRHGWDHMRSASERWQAVGSLLSGSHVANLKASWCGGQGLMPLVAGIDAAVSSLLSSLQWSCPPSPYAPRRREDGEHDGANEGAWRSSSASAVAGVVCWRMSVMCRSGLQAFVAAVGKYHTVGKKSHTFVDWPSVGNLFPFNVLSVFLATKLPIAFSPSPSPPSSATVASPSPMSPHSRQQR